MSEPIVRILRGAPDEAELAALIAVLSAVSAASRPPEAEVAVPRPRRPARFQAATSWRTLR